MNYDEQIALDLEQFPIKTVMQKHNLTKTQVYARYRKVRGKTAKIGRQRSFRLMTKASRNAEITKLRNEGYTYQQIADQYGLTKQRIHKIYHKVYKTSQTTASAP